MQLKDLKRIGLTNGEIKVYSALLELGECTKTDLAKKSCIAPSNIYDVTNRLLEKGIISKVEKNNVAHFSPANPKRILSYLTTKEEEVKKEKDLVSSLLPTLMAEFQKTKEGVHVEVFQGWEGLKNIFEGIIEELNSGEQNYVFGASRGEQSERADTFFLKYSKLREQKGIITNVIFNEDLRTRKERISFFMQSKKCNVRFLQQSTPAEINIYKNKACIIILTKEPLAIRITKQEVADSFKQYFDVLWAVAKR